MFQDLRFGMRMLLKNKSFTIVAILSLALGANTAIFQLINAVRLRTLPVEAPQELAQVHLSDTKGMRGGIGLPTSVNNLIWEQIRERQQAFSRVFAWGADSVNLAQGGEARPGRVLYVSGDFFTSLGLRPARGQLLTASDDQRGCAAPGVVISHGFWQSEYGGDANVVGRKLTLGDHSLEIIGVTPANFHRPLPTAPCPPPTAPYSKISPFSVNTIPIPSSLLVTGKENETEPGYPR